MLHHKDTMGALTNGLLCGWQSARNFRGGSPPHLIVKQCRKLGMVILIRRNISLKYDQGLHTRTESAEHKISPSSSRVGVCGDPVAPSPHTPPPMVELTTES